MRRGTDPRTRPSRGLCRFRTPARPLRALLALCWILLLALGATACQPAPPAPADPAAPAPGAPGAPSGEGERPRLLVYTSHQPEIYAPLIQAFQEETGILVELETGGTNELLQRIAREVEEPSDAGRPDLIFGGGVESLDGYKEDFAPYESPQLSEIDPRYCPADGSWTPFSLLPTVLVYNQRLVKPSSLRGFSDLLSERFHGRIAFADPRISGSAYTGLVALLESQDAPWEETMARFAALLDAETLKSSSLVIPKVGAGEKAVGISYEEAVARSRKDWPDLALCYPADGTLVMPDGMAIVRGTKHEDEARQFIDFMVSELVQRQLGRSFGRRPVLGSVAAAGEAPELADIPKLPQNQRFGIDERETLLRYWAELVPNPREEAEGPEDAVSGGEALVSEASDAEAAP